MKRLLPWLFLLGCSETGLSDASSPVANDEADGPVGTYEGLRIDLIPTELPTSTDDVVLLPQSIPVPTLSSSAGSYDAGTLQLDTPVALQATVTALERVDLLPAAGLPGEGELVAVPSVVRIVEPGTLHDYRVVADEEGAIAASVVPGGDYRVTVIPDDPRQPLTSLPWRSGDPLDLTLPTGASIYGRVTNGALALSDVELQLIDDAGVASAIATTDAGGFYELRAQPGEYTVRSLGRPFGEEPELSFPVTHGEDSTRLDVTYPVLDAVLVDLRVVDHAGEPLEGIGVRLRSTALLDTDPSVASYVGDKLTDDTGGILARVPAGTYEVMALPPSRRAGARHTPASLGEVRLEQDTDLGVVTLEPAIDVSGTVSDSGDVRLDGAVVSCREDGFGERSFTTVSDDEGRFALSLPAVPVRCSVSPPADRNDLALTLRSFDPRENREPVLRLSGGLAVRGVVRRGDEPEPFLVVEIRDAEGDLLGSALTDEDGAWSIQLPRLESR